MFAICERRFGVELEYNAFDNKSRSRTLNDLPSGIYDLALRLQKASGKTIEINKWSYTNNNHNWVLKPDSSCGIEICSPPFRGMHGYDEFYRVLSDFVLLKGIDSDSRCSMHVHVEIEDFSLNNLMFMVEKWINFELFFFMLTNTKRWLNQYCIPLGFNKNFDASKPINMIDMMEKLSDYKYYSINLFHYVKNRKKTVEFRCMGNEACVNPDDAGNWCKLLLCFVDRCKNQSQFNPIDIKYLNISDAIKFLDLDNYFQDDSIKFWIISKLNAVLHLEQNESFYFWNSVLDITRNDIIDTIEKMEQNLND